MPAAIAASVTLLSALLWAAALVLDPGPLAPESILLIGVGLLSLATTAVIGVIVTGARWAWRLGLAVIALCALIAIIVPIDAIWVAALCITALALVGWLSPPLVRSLRRQRPISGPPTRAMLIPLLLLGFPVVLGLAAWDESSWATVTVGLTAPLTALWYARVLPLGLLLVRVIWPVIAIGLFPAQPVVPAAVSAIAGITVSVLAWHPSVKVAFHPPREVGSSFPIPPELAPKEVLDTARLDDRGRPRG